jgi:hypothetical protein
MTVHHKDPCPCGSGKRYKHCHLPIDQARNRSAFAGFGIAVLVIAVGGLAFALGVGRPGGWLSPKPKDAGPPRAATTTTAAAGSGTTAGAGDVSGAQPPVPEEGAFGGIRPGAGANAMAPTTQQQGTTVQMPSPGVALAPGENPKPWEYDVARNRHYDPSPGHQHWHQGPPPANPDQMNVTPQVTTSSGSSNVKVSASQVTVAQSEPLAPGENPAPWQYDAKKNRYYDPRPEHRHWHPGQPPATPPAPTGVPTPASTPAPAPAPAASSSPGGTPGK